jgi:hypothetical protein
MIGAVNLDAAFAQLADHWSPRVVGRVNDQYVKVAKLLGELTWHKHDDEDELFQVYRGTLRIEVQGHSAQARRVLCDSTRHAAQPGRRGGVLDRSGGNRYDPAYRRRGDHTHTLH